ncbi:MAG TPA: ABC transporter permease, partial [Clostridiales bacterium]|nr:ABC transporter permease [Clostridiales bacterium]
YILLGDRKAAGSPQTVMDYIYSQTLFIPIIIFMIVIMASQMVAMTVTNEKADKTLETLLSAPVKRVSVLTAKMVAAGIMALVFAVFYMFGYLQYMDGFSGGMMRSAMDGGDAISSLGLALGPSDFALIGIQLFLTILICLSLSLILGSMAESQKQLQGLITPMIFLVMIPYVTSMFLDPATMPLPALLLIYAIPFTHTFIAAQNLFLNQYGLLAAGMAYQGLCLVLSVTAAVKVFTTDRIFTLKMPGRRFGMHNIHKNGNRI